MSLSKCAKSAERSLSSDREERARVRSRIGSLIMEFCRENYIFRMEDLTLYVQARMKVAPDSPGRILRELRRKGYLNYRVLSRRNSLYKMEKRPTEAERGQAELFARAS